MSGPTGEERDKLAFDLLRARQQAAWERLRGTCDEDETDDELAEAWEARADAEYDRWKEGD